MKIKTSEATTNQLNHLVARIEGVQWASWNREGWANDWAQGGPIIEREQIAIGYYAKIRGGLGVCATRAKVFDDKGWCLMYGETPLIAAMRCFVASKLGDEVDVPDDLI